MSRSLARASEQTVESLIACAIAFTASKSPFDDAAKPASMTSTSQPLELARDAELFVLGHRGAGRLLAVAQGGVEDDQAVGHGNSFGRKQNGPLRLQAGRSDETLGRGRSARPERSKKKQEGGTDSQHHGINIAQAGSAVQALLVGLVGRCCNHAHRLALQLLPDVHAVAGDAVGDEQAEQAPPGTWMLMTAMPSAISDDDDERHRALDAQVLEAVERHVGHHRQPGVEREREGDPAEPRAFLRCR